MPKATVRRFEVVTTDGIAKEMFRYDHATVISKEFWSCDLKWTHPELKEIYTEWLFVFDMVGEPTYKLWQSFGVRKDQITEIHLERGIYR